MRLISEGDLMYTSTLDIQRMLDDARVRLYGIALWTSEYYAIIESIRILEAVLAQRKRMRDFSGPKFCC